MEGSISSPDQTQGMTNNAWTDMEYSYKKEEAVIGSPEDLDRKRKLAEELGLTGGTEDFQKLKDYYDKQSTATPGKPHEGLKFDPRKRDEMARKTLEEMRQDKTVVNNAAGDIKQALG